MDGIRDRVDDPDPWLQGLQRGNRRLIGRRRRNEAANERGDCDGSDDDEGGDGGFHPLAPLATLPSAQESIEGGLRRLESLEGALQFSLVGVHA